MNPFEQSGGNEILRLIKNRASAREIVRQIEALDMGCAPTKDQWLSSVGCVTTLANTELDWFSRSDRVWVMALVTGYVIAALTDSRTEEGPSELELQAALLPFLQWLQRKPDDSILRFCWDVLSFRPRPYGSYRTFPIHWLRRNGRLEGEMSYQNIECAIVLADEAEAMFWWPDERWSAVDWDRDSQVYSKFFSHDSYVIRAAAAKALGALFSGCSRKATGSRVPEIADLLHWVQSQQQSRSGVAGPFLHGSQWWAGELLKAFPGYDFRTWFLETLRASSPEPKVPHMQSLEFYAHEFFCSDGEAIEAMLAMRRYELAVLTATEEPGNIGLLYPVLERMSKHEHRGVAQAITKYLAEREHHAGCDFVTQP